MFHVPRLNTSIVYESSSKRPPRVDERMDERRRVFHVLRGFLAKWKLTPISAQILFEVYKYPEHHVDVKTIRRKLPPKFKNVEIEEAIKSLVNRPIPLLKPYLPKPEDCYLCTQNGRFVASEIESQNLADDFASFSDMNDEFAEIERRVCDDAWGLTKGNTRTCNGTRGKILVNYSWEASTTPYRDNEFCWRIAAKFECPQCSHNLQSEFDINPENGTIDYVLVQCSTCRLQLRVQRALYQYYTE